MASTAQIVILPYGQPGGFAGQLTSPIYSADTQSASNSEVSLPFAYGTGVKPGVLLKSALLPTANNSVLAGIVLNEFVNAPGSFGFLDVGTPGGIKINTFATLLTFGRCYVPVSIDTVAGNDTACYWVYQTGGSDVIGQFRDTSNGNTVDVTALVKFKGKPFADASVLTGGTQLICEVSVNIYAKQ